MLVNHSVGFPLLFSPCVSLITIKKTAASSLWPFFLPAAPYRDTQGWTQTASIRKFHAHIVSFRSASYTEGTDAQKNGSDKFVSPVSSLRAGTLLWVAGGFTSSLREHVAQPAASCVSKYHWCSVKWREGRPSPAGCYHCCLWLNRRSLHWELIKSKKVKTTPVLCCSTCFSSGSSSKWLVVFGNTLTNTCQGWFVSLLAVTSRAFQTAPPSGYKMFIRFVVKGQGRRHVDFTKCDFHIVNRIWQEHTDGASWNERLWCIEKRSFVNRELQSTVCIYPH